MWLGDWLCRSVAEGPWEIPKNASFNGARITVIGEKPGAIVPHKRSNPCGTPGFVQ